MRNAFSLLFVLVSSVAFGQGTLEQADELIGKRKYDSAFKLLEEADKENKDPDIVLKKVDIALEFFAQSISHTIFAFKDLEEGEDLMEIRMRGEGQFSLYPFPIHEVLDSLIAEHPTNFKLHKALGFFYFEAHLKYSTNWLMDYREVIERMYKHCSLAADNDASDFFTHYCIGYYRLLKEDYESAIAPFLTSIGMNDEYPTSHYNLSICYLYTDQAAKGVPHAEKAMNLYEDKELKSDAARVAAVLSKVAEDLEGAVRYYKESNEIEPGNFNTLGQLLSLQLEMERMPAALETTHQFLMVNPKSPRICSELCGIFVKMEKGAELISFLEEKTGDYKGEDEVLGNLSFHIAKLYRHAKNKGKSKKYYLKAKKHFKKIFEPDHQVFKVIEEALAEGD